jgi:hypothetical protein
MRSPSRSAQNAGDGFYAIVLIIDNNYFSVSVGGAGKFRRCCSRQIAAASGAV